MARVFLLTVLFLVLSVSVAVAQEEEEEPIQARPNPFDKQGLVDPDEVKRDDDNPWEKGSVDKYKATNRISGVRLNKSKIAIREEMTQKLKAAGQIGSKGSLDMQQMPGR